MNSMVHRRKIIRAFHEYINRLLIPGISLQESPFRNPPPAGLWSETRGIKNVLCIDLSPGWNEVSLCIFLRREAYEGDIRLAGGTVDWRGDTYTIAIPDAQEMYPYVIEMLRDQLRNPFAVIGEMADSDRTIAALGLSKSQEDFLWRLDMIIQAEVLRRKRKPWRMAGSWPWKDCDAFPFKQALEISKHYHAEEQAAELVEKGQRILATIEALT